MSGLLKNAEPNYTLEIMYELTSKDNKKIRLKKGIRLNFLF